MSKRQIFLFQQVTLQIIEAYLPLKLGEIWAEYEQRNRDITPLNKYIVSTLVTRFRHWAIYIKNAQYSILREHNLEVRLILFFFESELCEEYYSGACENL